MEPDSVNQGSGLAANPLRLTQYAIASYSTPPVMPLGTLGASIASVSICSSVQNKLLAWQKTLCACQIEQSAPAAT